MGDFLRFIVVCRAGGKYEYLGGRRLSGRLAATANASLLAPTVLIRQSCKRVKRTIRAEETIKYPATLPVALGLFVVLGVLPGCRANSAASSTDEIVDSVAPESGAVVSLLGDTLEFPLFDEETTERLESDAITAAERLETYPTAENYVWLGRRLGYLWRYNRAIDVFTNGIRGYPDAPALYRHRGHRYITTRQFTKAIADLRAAASLVEGQADVIEEDGAPNEFNKPRTTLHFNIWYHLGLAYYLSADFDRATSSFQEALDVSRNDDAIVAATDWLYMSLRRNDKHSQAEALLQHIQADMEILENGSYHRRLLMYKGNLPPDSLLDRAGADDLDLATQGYGVANWHLVNGREQEARQLFADIVSGDYWPAFGYIAAEAEIARLSE